MGHGAGADAAVEVQLHAPRHHRGGSGDCRTEWKCCSVLIIVIVTVSLCYAMQRLKTVHMKFKDIRFIFGMYDVSVWLRLTSMAGSYDICNCNLPGYQNDPIICYRRNSHCLPNAFGGRGCCDTTRKNNMVVNTCGYRLQGPSRLQRGLLYMQYLSHIWSTAPTSRHGRTYGSGGKIYQPLFAIVDKMRHNSSTFYSSKSLLKWVRGKHS